MRSWLLLALALALLACRAHSDRAGRDQPDGVHCDPLPTARPAKARVRVTRVHGDSLERTLDVVFVAADACPASTYVESPPDCVLLTDAAMDYVWKELRATSPHTLAHETRGRCIHCGGPSIDITWPGGFCGIGNGHEHYVAERDWQRFMEGVVLLEAAAAAGGVKPRPTLSPR